MHVDLTHPDFICLYRSLVDVYCNQTPCHLSTYTRDHAPNFTATVQILTSLNQTTKSENKFFLQYKIRILLRFQNKIKVHFQLGYNNLQERAGTSGFQNKNVDVLRFLFKNIEKG